MHENPNNKSKVMGDDLPLELQEEIIKRIDDLKTLLRCTSVSKAWNSLIKTPAFIADYHIQRQRHHLLVQTSKNFVSIVDDDNDDDDDDTFPQNRLSLPFPAPVKRYWVQGSSLGLFCYILDNYERCYYNDVLTAVIWNPSIRKSITVNYRVTGSYFNKNYRQAFGFGVSPHTNDPMIVKITYSRFLGVVHDSDSDEEADHISLDSIPSLPVEVYTLSSRVWTTLSTGLPRKTILLNRPRAQVVVGEFIYWVAYDRELDGNRFYTNGCLILSFDMRTREFIEICLPEELERCWSSVFCLSKLRESLVVVERAYGHNYIVWMMEGGRGVPNSFAKLNAINFPIAYDISTISIMPFRFRKSGGLIVLVDRDCYKHEHLLVCDPDSEHTYKIGIHGRLNYFDSYMETLLLLNH